MDAPAVLEMAGKVASRYARRCWWADKDDMRQVATVAILEAHGTFDSSVGVPIEGYAWRAAVLAVRHYLWKNTAPVNESDHNVKNLRGVVRAPVEDALSVADENPTPEDEARRLLWHKRAHEAIRAVLDDGVDGHLAEDVLLHEMKPAEVARRHDVVVTSVYEAVSTARRRLRIDLELWELWNEQP